MFTSGMFSFLISQIKNPKAIFIRTLLTKWYLIVMIPSIAIAYKVFRILDERGLLADLEEFVTSQLEMISETVDRCTALDIDLSSFTSLFKCL